MAQKIQNIKNDVAHSLVHIIKYVKRQCYRELNSRENGIICGNYRVIYTFLIVTQLGRLEIE